MNLAILATRVSASSLVSLRDRTRQVAELFGLDTLQCTRFVTAVSEIVRNTVQYAGEGTATFLVSNGGFAPQQLIAQIADKGPGIDDLGAVLAGRLNAKGQVPLGIAGCKKLADKLTIEPVPGGGTLVTIAMSAHRNARQLAPADIARIGEKLSGRKTLTALEEVEQINREMLFTLEQLRLRQLELQMADERKNQFLSTVAHELRNPLGTLQMTLDLIAHKGGAIGADELLRRCEVMSRQTKQLARLVDDLMDVSRVTHGKVELEKRPAEVNALVSQAVEMTGAATHARSHEVEVKLHDGELWINGDASRLKQVLSNLIQNAARYTPEKGRIAISVRREATNAVVVVADNGIGIEAQVLPHVFELFVQGATGGKENKAGLGVGLTLVQRLTEDHGGTVRATSEGLGLGSQFTVTLPLAPMKDSPQLVLH